MGSRLEPHQPHVGRRQWHRPVDALHGSRGIVPLVVTIPPAPGNTQGKPTGIVFNTTSLTATPNFLIPPSGGLTRFIFATEDGLIAAWSGGTTAVQVYPPNGGTPAGAVSQRIGPGQRRQCQLPYATDFVAGKIDVFDKNFALVTSPGGFVDPDLKRTFHPSTSRTSRAIGSSPTRNARRRRLRRNRGGRSLGIVDEFDAPTASCCAVSPSAAGSTRRGCRARSGIVRRKFGNALARSGTSW